MRTIKWEKMYETIKKASSSKTKKTPEIDRKLNENKIMLCITLDTAREHV